MVELTALLLGAALASPAEDALDAADHAFAAGDRRAAREAWRALEDDPDPAIAARAATRMLLVSGNLGFAVHGPRADRALAACPPADPRCLLAEADYELLLHQLGLPGDPGVALERAREAQGALPGAAADRVAWAQVRAGDRTTLPPAQTGTGAAVAAGRGSFGPWPGTWVLGLGVVAAPGLGVGGSVRMVDPDLRWTGWRLQAEALATSRGLVAAQVATRSPGRWFATGQAWGTRRPFDVYEGDTRTTTVVGTGELRAGVGRQLGALAVELGPVARWDAASSAVSAGHGAASAITWRGGGSSAALRATAAVADYDHLDLVLDLRPQVPLWGGVFAVQALGAVAPLATSPVVRLPALGGGAVLRSVPVGRYRAAQLGAGVAEWRTPAWGLLAAVAFAEGAWVAREGWMAGGGAGVRLRLPPQPLNTVRLDLAGGTAGWAVTAGVGEAF